MGCGKHSQADVMRATQSVHVLPRPARNNVNVCRFKILPDEPCEKAQMNVGFHRITTETIVCAMTTDDGALWI